MNPCHDEERAEDAAASTRIAILEHVCLTREDVFA